MIDKIKIAKRIALKNYDKDASKTNTDCGKEMIVFCYKTLSSKPIIWNGGDLDEDQFIGLTKDGWIKYINKTESCGGKFSIVEQSEFYMTDEQIVGYLEGSNCTESEYNYFMFKIEKYLNLE